MEVELKRIPSLLLGIGPYNTILQVKSTKCRRELGNMLIDAPTRAGKGLLATSQLLTWPFSVVVNDMKGDLYTRTGRFRASLGPVFVVDPRGFGHSLDPLRHARTEEDFRAMAVHLLHRSHDHETDPFTGRAVRMLTAIFWAGYLERARLIPYAAHLIHTGPEAIAARLQAVSERHRLKEHQNLATRFLDRQYADADFSDRYFQSSWSTLWNDMDPIITETVIKSVATSDFTAEDILCGRETIVAGRNERKPVTVYLRFPEHRLRAFAPLIRLIWGSLIDEMVTLYDTRGGEVCNPVLLLIDEAGTAPVPGLPEYAATVAGRGISIWAAFQDLNQQESVYSRSRAETLRNNMETQLFYRQSGLATSEYVEKRLGKKSDFAHSKTTHGHEAHSEGEVEQAVSLMTAQDVAELSDEEIIILHRNRKPIRAKRMDFRNFPELGRLTTTPPSALPTLPDPDPIPDLSPDFPHSDEFGP
jgi:type IV secretion system protein VirD4